MAFEDEDLELIDSFLAESTELLERLDEDLIELEKTPENVDLLNRAFRSIHTIKGSAGFLGFDLLVMVAHKTEDVLNRLRKDEIRLDSIIMDAILAATEAIKQLIDDLKGHEIIDRDMSGIIDKLVPFLTGTPTQDVATTEKKDEDPAPMAQDAEPQPAAIAETSAKPEAEADAQPVVAAAAPTTAAPGEAAPAREEQETTVRIDVKRLDDLMNQVGELVLERNRMAQMNEASQAGALQLDSESFSQLSKRLNFITGELQTQVMKLRMIPVEKVFKKFPRMVRSLSRDLGKDVELRISGEETELDRSVVDQIGDPLVHLIRNALDHGLETPEERVKAGKPKNGTLLLSASHEGNQILITIKDDGRGLDTAKITRKAIEKGLVTEEQVATMPQKEMFDLIFLPGFSTKEVASDVSGRGVGMDVVQTNLRKINGTIDINSTLGEGSEFLLRLPLTLAIIQSLMVEVEGEVYAIPLSSVLETIKATRSSFNAIGSNDILSLRDQVLPLVHLDRFFKVPPKNADDECNIVVVGVTGRKVGFIVSKLLGQQEVAIKSLGKYIPQIKGIAGSTILGDGKVALILDPARIANNGF